MKRPDSQVPTPSSPAPTPSGLKRNLLRTILGGALLVGVPASANVGCAEMNDAKAVKSQSEKLMSVKSFLKENSEKLKRYSALSPEAMARQAGPINTILKELIDEIKKAKSAADEIGKTKVRFNPNMFEALIISLDLTILKLSGGKVGRLNEGANKMRKSRDGWGFHNRMARRKGVNPNAVIYMSQLIGQLKKVLGELRTSVLALEKKGIAGCSNNSFVSSAIEEKLGSDHCHDSNAPFCKAIRPKSKKGKLKTKIKPVPAVAVQRELIARNFLGENMDDGNFGKESRKAYKRARRKSKKFRKMIRKCKK